VGEGERRILQIGHSADYTRRIPRVIGSPTSGDIGQNVGTEYVESSRSHGRGMLAEEAPIDWIRRLSPMEKALLERLASGSTISAAATAEFLSLRTANRRIAELRRRAGVSTTRELVGIYRSSRER